MRFSRNSWSGISLHLSERVIGILSIVLLLVLWEALSRTGHLSPYHFPRPTKLAGTLWGLAWTGIPRGVTIWHHIWATVWRIIKGYLLAAALAIPLGMVIGVNRLLDQAANVIITFARSVAIISLLPLFVAWFGVGELARVLLITYGCFWIILTNVIEGVKQVDPEYIRAGKMLESNQRQIFFRIVLPATLPRIFAGMKIALGVSFAVIVAVEMVGTIEGLGALIMESRTFYRSDAAMVGMVFIALFGFSLAKVLDWLEGILLPWATGIEEVER